jgi:hypothetical protein
VVMMLEPSRSHGDKTVCSCVSYCPQYEPGELSGLGAKPSIVSVCVH